MNVVKIADLRNNIKSITDTVISKDQPVMIAGPKNKNLVLMSLENFNHLNSNKMESQINFKDDFRYNEGLHHAAQELSTAYSRLIRNHPEHRDIALWKEEKTKWPAYNEAIKDMVFVSEEKADAELNRVSAELKKVLKLEETLEKKNKSLHLA